MKIVPVIYIRMIQPHGSLILLWNDDGVEIVVNEYKCPARAMGHPAV
jgi:hypothetical protein